MSKRPGDHHIQIVRNWSVSKEDLDEACGCDEHLQKLRGWRCWEYSPWANLVSGHDGTEEDPHAGYWKGTENEEQSACAVLECLRGH